MILTYRYRLKGKRATRQLRRFAQACNQIWNFCAGTQRDANRRWKNGSNTKWPTHYELATLAKGMSADLGVHSKSIAGVCEQFAKSRDLHVTNPRFRKSFGSKRSLGWIPFPTTGRRVDQNSISYCRQTYRFFGAKRRPLPAVVKGGAFVENARGQWFVCLHVEVDELPTGQGEVGIDLGLKTLATLNNGEKIEAPQHYRRLENSLASAQRSGNRRRTRAIHAKIANARRDHLHKASAKIARENRFIVVGNVSSSKLARTKMAKSVLDAGWSTFREMLRYKASRHGAQYLEVDESFTTQTCSSCGDRSSPGRPKGIAGLGIREWVCSSCGANHDRDVNAAKNILVLGLSAQPRVDGSRKRIGTSQC